MSFDNDEADFNGSIGNDSASKIPERTLTRLLTYLCALDDFERCGISTCSSSEIAKRAGVKSGLVRKDLCHFGGFGRPSVGYNVAYLRKQIRDILKVNDVKHTALIGARILLYDKDFIKKLAETNCLIDAVFDKYPNDYKGKTGYTDVLPIDSIEQIVKNIGINFAILSETGEETPLIVDNLTNGGVKAILNLTPSVINPPDGVTIRNIDIAGEMLILSYYCNDTQQKEGENDIISTDAEIRR
ncbi:MAG: redox-sensing transcriptional repressor Rex [Armatimonadota bacterium]